MSDYDLEENNIFILKFAQDWPIWKIHIQTELCSEGVVDHIFDQPLLKDNAESYLYNAWNRRDQVARAIIRRYISVPVLLSLTKPRSDIPITSQDNAFTLWSALWFRFEGFDYIEIEKQRLECQLDCLVLEDPEGSNELDALLTEFLALANQFKAIGCPKTETELSQKLMNALPTHTGAQFQSIYVQWLGGNIVKAENEGSRSKTSLRWILNQLRVIYAAQRISEIEEEARLDSDNDDE